MNKIFIIVLLVGTSLFSQDVSIKSSLMSMIDSLMPEDLFIADGTMFKISDTEKAIIINGKIKCNQAKGFIIGISKGMNCTNFDIIDKSKTKVHLITKDKSLNEFWTINLNDKVITITRPNGFIIQKIKD